MSNLNKAEVQRCHLSTTNKARLRVGIRLLLGKVSLSISDYHFRAGPLMEMYIKSSAINMPCDVRVVRDLG
jgi:hypothetical protein